MSDAYASHQINVRRVYVRVLSTLPNNVEGTFPNVFRTPFFSFNIIQMCPMADSAVRTQLK